MIPDRTSTEGDHTVAPSFTITNTNNQQPTLILQRNDSALPVGTKLGDFEIIDIIGWGGFGIVYLAYDHSLRIQVALKEYMPSSLAFRDLDGTVSVQSEKNQATYQAGLHSFINEARILAKIQEHADHPSLVKVFRFWEDHGTAYMVMPFYEGKTLKETLQTMTKVPDENWLRTLLNQLLDALTILHERNCLHRDIAPDNILILTDGRALLLDFGAARQVISNLTQSLTVILKPGYAPIEQYAEETNLKQGPWTDIYALAAVIYFAITGKVPPDSVSRLISDPLIPLSQCAKNQYSSNFLNAIDKALTVKPDGRPKNVKEFKSLLGSNEPLATSSHTQSSIIAALIAVLILGSAFIYNFIPEETTKEPFSSNPSPGKEKLFDPINILDEIFDYRDRNHAVTVSIDKIQFKINKDQLNFKIHSSKPGYIYTLAVGSDRSNFFLFFPNEVDQENFIRANEQIELPRDKWKLTSRGPAGTNHFIVIVSKYPRDFSNTGFYQDSFFGTFSPERARELYQSHTGTVPLFAGKAICSSSASTEDCTESYGAALFTIKEVEE